MTIPMKSLLRAAVLSACAMSLGACVYDGRYRDRYNDDGYRGHYYSHNDSDRYRHDDNRGDSNRGDYDRDGE